MMKLTEIKAEIERSRYIAQWFWDSKLSLEDYIGKEWMHIDIDVCGDDPEEHNHVCIYSDSDANYEAGTVYDKWVCIWEKGKNVIESSSTRIERQKKEATICDKCDNEADVSCPHCGDEFCQACFHNIGEGEHCSEAPDAQPRGVVKEYCITWAIEVDGESAQDAVNQAVEMLRDPESTATIFQAETEGEKPVMIDYKEHNNE